VEEVKQRFEEFKNATAKINADNKQKKDFEAVLTEAMQAENLQEGALREAINKAKSNKVDGRIVYAAEKFLKNAVIKNAIQSLKEKLEAFDEEGVKQAQAFILKEGILVDEELQNNAEDFFANIEANPNYVQEKLAELKKQPKQGKKK
jgi:hypothetical protein